MNRIRRVRDGACNSNIFQVSLLLYIEKNESSHHGFVFQDLKWQEKIPILWECLILR